MGYSVRLEEDQEDFPTSHNVTQLGGSGNESLLISKSKTFLIFNRDKIHHKVE